MIMAEDTLGQLPVLQPVHKLSNGSMPGSTLYAPSMS